MDPDAIEDKVNAAEVKSLSSKLKVHDYLFGAIVIVMLVLIVGMIMNGWAEMKGSYQTLTSQVVEEKSSIDQLRTQVHDLETELSLTRTFMIENQIRQQGMTTSGILMR